LLQVAAVVLAVLGLRRNHGEVLIPPATLRVVQPELMVVHVEAPMVVGQAVVVAAGKVELLEFWIAPTA
jgi:hypothetical protein